MTFYEEDYEYCDEQRCGCMWYWLEEPERDEENYVTEDPDRKIFCHNHAMMERADMEHDNVD